MRNIWFKWIKAIINTCDNPDGYIKLSREGVDVACIQPQTKEYWKLKDIVHELKWESYPEPSGYKNDKPYYLLWYGDVAIIFDDFYEEWN